MPARRIALTACLAGLLFGADAAKADDDDDRPPPAISVTGRGKVSAAPDVADIQVGVVTQAKTAREALSANNAAMTALMDVLKERGVAAKDVQTSGLNVSPQYSTPAQPVPADYVPKIVSYSVTNTVRITARDLPKLGQVLDAVVGAGANQMNGISFRFDDPEALLDQARKKAMADARRKAQLLADEGGVVLGAPISIREEGSGPPRPPVPMMGRMAMMAADAAVPVAAGEQDLNVSIDVVYRIKDAK